MNNIKTIQDKINEMNQNTIETQNNTIETMERIHEKETLINKLESDIALKIKNEAVKESSKYYIEMINKKDRVISKQAELIFDKQTDPIKEKKP